MRDQFRQFYRPSSDEYEALWKDAVFVFDTNVLLKAYEVRQETCEALVKAMKILSEDKRVWLAYQTVREFYFVRHRPLDENKGILNRLRSFPDRVRELHERTKDEKPAIPADYPHADPDELFQFIERALRKYQKRVDEIADSISPLMNRLDDDHVLTAYESIFEGKVGAEPEPEKVDERTNKWTKHRKGKRPPGKSDDGPLDYLIWCELIDQMKGADRPVVLITDDGGWFLKIGKNDNVWGPHPDLVKEFHMLAGTDQRFWAYKSKDFLVELQRS